MSRVDRERFIHAEDPIGSDVYWLGNWFSNFQHDVADSTVLTTTWRCSSRWWFVCYAWEVDTVTASPQACGTESGGCSNTIECAYNFRTTHNMYEDYFGN